MDEDLASSNVALDTRQAHIALAEIPGRPGIAARIFSTIALGGAVVDNCCLLPLHAIKRSSKWLLHQAKTTSAGSVSRRRPTSAWLARPRKPKLRLLGGPHPLDEHIALGIDQHRMGLLSEEGLGR